MTHINYSTTGERVVRERERRRLAAVSENWQRIFKLCKCCGYDYFSKDISQNILANNGLSFSGDTLQLGGNLTKNTTINASGKEFKIDTLKKLTIANENGLNQIYTDSNNVELNVQSTNIGTEANRIKMFI